MDKTLKFSEWLRLSEVAGATGPYINRSKSKGGGCGKHTDFQVSGACSDANSDAENVKISNGGKKKR